MSSNDVDIEKQVSRHRGPLVGKAIIAGVVVILLVMMLSDVLDGERENPVVPAGADAPAIVTY